MKTLAIRLKPGDDLKQSLNSLVKENKVHAASVLTCVGSLQNAILRLANSDKILHKEGPFEIVSLVGTFSQNGSHLHCCLSDANGQVIGGHLLDGNRVFTTAETVLFELDNYLFTREFDEDTGFNELVVRYKD